MESANFPSSTILELITFSCLLFSDPVINSNSNERSNVQRLLEKLILEEDQFDVHDILPNTMPDPASLQLKSDYACPIGQVVMAPDCGKLTDTSELLAKRLFLWHEILLVLMFYIHQQMHLLIALRKH